MKKSIIPTLPENFNEIKQILHQLQPPDPRSISKITIYANFSVSPIDIEL